MSCTTHHACQCKEERIRRLEKVADASYAAIPKVLVASNLGLDLGLRSEIALLNIAVALSEAGYDTSKIMPKRGGT